MRISVRRETVLEGDKFNSREFHSRYHMLENFARRATSQWRALIIFYGLIFPVLIAIWFVPWLMTQDGPLHLYNAQIMIELLKPGSSLHNLYAVHWTPMPYWTAHLSLTGLLGLLSERLANRVMLTLTSVGFAGSIIWLRWRVAGWQGMAIVAPLAVILSLTILWLMGLYGFLLGACFFVLTLGIWWQWRERMGIKQAAILAGLLALGYLSHPVSFGLTVIGIIILALTTPGHGWMRRRSWTAVGLIPSLFFIIIYRLAMKSNGEAGPTWSGINNFGSLGDWLGYLRRGDLILLRNSKSSFPFVEADSGWFSLLSPSTLVVVALVLLAVITFRSWNHDNSSDGSPRGWIILSLLFIIGGLFGPDSFGVQHGSILRERVLLLGLAAIVPVLKVEPKRLGARVAGAALALAAIIQIAFVWEYALASNREVNNFLQAKSYVGVGQRVEVLLVNQPSRFRALPTQNLANLFGFGTNNLIWNNYGPSLYYFPIRFRDNSIGVQAFNLTSISSFYFTDSGEKPTEQLKEWGDLLDKAHDDIDVLVVFGFSRDLDMTNFKWYDSKPVFEQGNIRVFQGAQPKSDGIVKLARDG